MSRFPNFDKAEQQHQDADDDGVDPGASMDDVPTEDDWDKEGDIAGEAFREGEDQDDEDEDEDDDS